MPLVFLPGESHGQSGLAGYSPWGRRVRHDRSDLACTHACRKQIGNSLAVQWLGLDTLTAGKSLGSIPGWGIKIP